MLRQQILADLKISLEKLGISGVEPSLENPKEEKNGDYSTNCAMVIYKQQKSNFVILGRSKATTPESKTDSGQARMTDKILNQVQDDKKIESPLSLAQTIVANFPQTDYLEKVEAVAPGFINFWLKQEHLYNSMLEAVKMVDDYGKTDLLKGQKIMVEFSHPNTHKMFHIGHLRNITTGETVVRLLEANGAKVIRANYQGDVGMHIAKCLYGILQISHKRGRLSWLKTLDEKVKFLGECYVAGAKAYEESEAAKKEIGEINKKIYQKDPEVIKLWQETRKWSLEYFERIYKRVDTHFDRFYFESECLSGVDLANLASQGSTLQNQILEKSEGAIIFNGKPYGLDTRVFVNSLGLPTYEAKELALAKMELSEFGKLSRIIHVVGPEQASFFKVTFKVEELLQLQKDQQFHLIYGWVKLKHGKMSSRSGQVVLGEWLLDEAKKRLQEKFKMEEKTAEVVAVGAVKYSLLKVGLSSEIAFDIDESINLDGDSGPYLQYAYARCMSVLKKAVPKATPLPPMEHRGFSKGWPYEASGGNWEPEELSLLRTLYKFPEIVANAGINYSPNLLCGYLFDLAGKFNLFYNRLSILNPEPQEARPLEAVREIRLKLTEATGQILKNGLYLLGIKTVEKM